MRINLSPYCHVLEKNGKVLLFDSRSLEMALMTESKFHGELNGEDIARLENCHLAGAGGEGMYTLESVFPEHISKAYLLFGTDCNISCQYCTVKHNAEKYPYKGAMTKDILCKSLALLFEKNIGLEHITLYGGEPLLHKERVLQFFQYLELLPPERVPKIDLITNGTLFDKDILKKLLQWDVLVLVSLDGMKTHHDTFRLDMQGNGTYERVVSGVAAYRDAGLRVGISMVLGMHNYKDIRSICTKLKKEYNIVSIGLTLPHMEPDVATDEEFDSFLREHYDEMLNVCQEQGLWFEQGMKRLLSLAEKKRYIYGCPTTPKGSMLRILPDGTITLCENMGLRGLYQLGNVNDIDLTLPAISSNPLFRQWYERCTNNVQKCRDCIAYSVCGMGCPYDAWLQCGTIDNIESRSCSISRQAINWYLDRVVRMAVISDTDKVKILDTEEKKKILVECPWEKRQY